MKKLYENIDWRKKSVVGLADKNVHEARKMVKKEKEGVRELLAQGISSKKLKGLSETDKELLAALYLLIYKEKNKLDDKTNSEFIQELFGVDDISELIHDIELFKENTKDIIIDPLRKKALEDKKEKPEEEKKEKPEKKKKEKPEEKKKEKPEEKKKDDEDEEEKKDDENEEEKKSLVKERGFEKAMKELEDAKNEAIKKLDKLLPKAKNQRAIQKQKDEIERNFTKRLNTMKKAQAGSVMSPRLRVQQELASGRSFIDRAVNTAQSAQMPGAAGRAVSAVRDARKAIGRETGAARDALGKTLPARIAKQIRTDARSRFVYQQLGAEQAEKFIYSNDKDEKNKIYDQAMKARTERRAKGDQAKPVTSKTDPEEEERKRKERESLKPRKRTDKPDDQEDKQQISSTDYSGLNTINEQIKGKIKNNMVIKD